MSEKIQDLSAQRQAENKEILGIKEPGRIETLAKYVLSSVGIEIKKDEIPTFEGGVEMLKSPEECTSPQEALGVFWANQLMVGIEKFKNEEMTSRVMGKIGGFAKAVEYIAQKRRDEEDKGRDYPGDSVEFKVDFSPEGNLRDAIRLAGLATNDSGEPDNRFFIGSLFTHNTRSSEKDGVVLVNAIGRKRGRDKNGEVCDIQIWPRDKLSNKIDLDSIMFKTIPSNVRLVTPEDYKK